MELQRRIVDHLDDKDPWQTESVQNPLEEGQGYSPAFSQRACGRQDDKNCINTEVKTQSLVWLPLVCGCPSLNPYRYQVISVVQPGMCWTPTYV